MTILKEQQETITINKANENGILRKWDAFINVITFQQILL